MQVEILYPEICNLFGDSGNVQYLERLLPEAVFFRTPFGETPRFLSEDVSLVYMGPMTEHTQERLLELLMPHREAICAAVERGVTFLCTGNAFEIFGERIENEDGSAIEGLRVFPLTAKRNRDERHNSAFLGRFEDVPVMGFKSQFSMAHMPDAENGAYGLFRVEKGVGLDRAAKFEGVHYKNFFGTYLLGPVLILNPPFAKRLLAAAGANSPAPVFEEAMRRAYETRLAEFRAPDFVAEKPPESNRLPIHLPKFLKRNKP